MSSEEEAAITPAPTQQSERERRSNLGRGLAALFGDSGTGTAAPAGVDADAKRHSRSVPLEHLHPNPNQPRQLFNDEPIRQLAQSIRENGLLQPILVRPHPVESGQYEIIAGERRWRAAQKAQLHEVPVVIRELSDVKSLEIALLENIQREDLTPIEEAEGFQRLMAEFAYTQENLARALGKSRSYIANALRLLTLPADVQALVNEGQLSAGHARALVVADDPSALSKKVVSDGLSVRQTENLAKTRRSESARPGGRKQGPKSLSGGRAAQLTKDADTLALERDLAQVLGLAVAISFEGGGSEKGTLTLSYENLDQLDDLVRRLNSAPGPYA